MAPKKLNTILNYIKVSDTLSTSGQPTKKQFKTIAKNGFDVVINLAMHNKGALKEEDKIVSKNGMVYIHIPVTWKAPEPQRLQLFVSLLQQLEREKKKIFIHCIMNYRVSMFIYYYKKHIRKEPNAVLIAPTGYKPNKIWRNLIMKDS